MTAAIGVVSDEAQAWLSRFFALPPDSQRRVRRYILFTSCGQLDELMATASEQEKQTMLDKMVAAYHADDPKSEADACYQPEPGFSYDEIAAWGAR